MSRTNEGMAVAGDALRRLLLALPPNCPPLTLSRAQGGLRVTLTVGPAVRRAPEPDAIADRERVILDITRQTIQDAGRRVRGAELRLAVRAAGCGWGDSVIIRVLADLVAAGQLVNGYDGNGYGLPNSPDVCAA